MKVLAAIDGSVGSESVIDALSHRVWRAGTVIKLVLVMAEQVEPYRFKGGYHRIDYAPDIESPAKLHQTLVRFSELLRERLGPRNSEVFIDPEIMLGGAGGTILGIAKRWLPDLVVLGTHDRRGLERVRGSVSMDVRDRAQSNILIARARGTCTDDRVFRILLPVDHSSHSLAAVGWFLQQSWKRELEIRLITVSSAIPQSLVNLEDYTGMTNNMPVQEEFLRSLESLAYELTMKTNAAVSFNVEEGDPKEAILSAACTWNADLIIMGSHGHTGLKRLMLGSVSSFVSRNAKMSVEIVKVPGVK